MFMYSVDKATQICRQYFDLCDNISKLKNYLTNRKFYKASSNTEVNFDLIFKELDFVDNL